MQEAHCLALGQAPCSVTFTQVRTALPVDDCVPGQRLIRFGTKIHYLLKQYIPVRGFGVFCFVFNFKMLKNNLGLQKNPSKIGLSTSGRSWK